MGTDVNLEQRSEFHLSKAEKNMEKVRNIIENKGVNALNIRKMKARNSLRKGNEINIWNAGNSLKRKSGKSLNAKVGQFLAYPEKSQKTNAGNSLKKLAGNRLNDGHQERKSRIFKTRKSFSSLLKRKKTIETRKKTDVKGKERHPLSVFSRKNKIPERRKYSFRISRSVSEDSTTTLEDDLETYTTQVPLTEKRKSFLLSFFDAIKTKFDKEKE